MLGNLVVRIRSAIMLHFLCYRGPSQRVLYQMFQLLMLYNTFNSNDIMHGSTYYVMKITVASYHFF